MKTRLVVPCQQENGCALEQSNGLIASAVPLGARIRPYQVKAFPTGLKTALIDWHIFILSMGSVFLNKRKII